MSKEKDLDLSNIVLFRPRNGKSLVKSYKEIAENPKLAKLADNECLFAWYMGIPNSPVDESHSAVVRQRTAASLCFPKNPEKKVDFAEGNFGDEVKVAIQEFSKFSPEARWIANKINEAAIKKFMTMVNVKDEEFYVYKDIKEKDGTITTVKEIDHSAKKQYTDMVAQINRTLPDLIKQSEDGFGITEEKKSEMVGKKPIDDFHQEKRDRTSF